MKVAILAALVAAASANASYSEQSLTAGSAASFLAKSARPPSLPTPDEPKPSLTVPSGALDGLRPPSMATKYCSDVYMNCKMTVTTTTTVTQPTTVFKKKKTVTVTGPTTTVTDPGATEVVTTTATPATRIIYKNKGRTTETVTAPGTTETVTVSVTTTRRFGGFRTITIG